MLGWVIIIGYMISLLTIVIIAAAALVMLYDLPLAGIALVISLAVATCLFGFFFCKILDELFY